MKIKFRRTKDISLTATEMLSIIDEGHMEKNGWEFTPDMVEDAQGTWYSIYAEKDGMRISTIDEYTRKELEDASQIESQRKVNVINIRLTYSEKRRLERISNLTGQNMTDVVCNALIMYEASIDADSCTE